MTTAIYLEHYLESLENLPVELQRNFNLMRDLDGRAQGVMKEIDRVGGEYLETASTIVKERKKEINTKLQKLFNKAREYGDDKVQLAIQTYELVDKHIRRLDSDLARFETEIKNGTVHVGQAGATTNILSPRSGLIPIGGGGVSGVDTADTSISVDKTTKKGRKREKEPVIKKSKISKTDTDEKVSKAGTSGAKGKGSVSPGISRKKQKSEIQLVAEQVAATSSGEVLDMPVDPNEPTYCICHQVSFGQMIACDNPDCPIEWFHIACMGLSSIPKGKWFCPKCQPLRKK